MSEPTELLTEQKVLVSILKQQNTNTNNNQNKNNNNVLLSAQENAILGMIGGGTETFVQMPINTAKFCFQEGRPLPRTIPGLYRGVGIQVGSMAPITAVQVTTNGLYQKLLGAEKRKLTNFEAIVCSMGAGMTSAFIYGPADLMMIHQQKLGTSLVKTYQQLVAKYNFFIPWRGLASCMLREAVYVGGYLGFSPVVTQKIRDYTKSDNQLLTGIAGSCVMGTICAFGSHPIDTAKTVFQADLDKKNYKSATDAFRKLMKTEGVTSLYRGGMMRTIRVCGAFTIIGGIREFCVGRKQGSPDKFLGLA